MISTQTSTPQATGPLAASTPQPPLDFDLVDAELIRELDDTPFLRRCREGRATRAEIAVFLVQHFHYSRHFTRYLCALLASMEDDDHRFELSENLFEEMGLGGVGEIPHSKIYRQMLTRLGLDPAAHPPTPATRELVSTALFLCRSEDPLDGLGALCIGAEAIVPHIYAQIRTGMRAAGISEDDLYFFTLHIDHDDDHALTMKRIINQQLAGDPARSTRLKASARRMLRARRRFFEEVTLHVV